MDTAAILGLLLSTHLSVHALCSPGSLVRKTLFLAGLCASVATIFHTTALLWAGSIGILVFAFSRDRLKCTLVFGIGAALLSAAWLAYALQFPSEFYAQYLTLLLNRTGEGGVLQRLVAEGERYVREFARLPAVYVALLVGAGGLVAQRRWSDRPVLILLVLTGLVFLMHGLVAGKNSGFYSLYPMTLAFCLLGIGIDAVLARADAVPGRRWITAGSLTVVAALLVNLAIFSVGPRVAAFWFQGATRDYALQLEGLSSRLSPGDQVWGTAVAWLAVIKAGARLDALEWVPRAVDPRPDPMKHKYVVVFRGDDFPGTEAYRKIAEIGSQPPRVFGASLTNKPYTFDLWRSHSMP